MPGGEGRGERKPFGAGGEALVSPVSHSPGGREARLLSLPPCGRRLPGPPPWAAASFCPWQPSPLSSLVAVTEKWQWNSLFKDRFNKPPINKWEEEATGNYLLVLTIKLKGEEGSFLLVSPKAQGPCCHTRGWDKSTAPHAHLRYGLFKVEHYPRFAQRSQLHTLKKQTKTSNKATKIPLPLVTPVLIVFVTCLKENALIKLVTFCWNIYFSFKSFKLLVTASNRYLQLCKSMLWPFAWTLCCGVTSEGTTQDSRQLQGKARLQVCRLKVSRLTTLYKIGNVSYSANGSLWII